MLVQGGDERGKMKEREWALMVFNAQDLAEPHRKKKKSSDPEFNKLDFSILNMTTCKESRSGARVV